MNESIDFYVPIIDNYWDIWFALNLALIMVLKNPKLKVRFFSDDEKLFDKMMGYNIENWLLNKIQEWHCSEIQGRFPSSREWQFIQFYNLNDLSNYIPSKTIFTFFDYKLPSEYIKKWEKWKTIIQFWYFLLHKWIENLHNTSYEIDWNKFIHFIPSLIEKTWWIIINKIKDEKLKTKEEYLNYINKKYNLEISKNLLNKKWISVFVYKDTLNEVIEVIKERKAEVFFIFDSWKRIQESTIQWKWTKQSIKDSWNKFRTGSEINSGWQFSLPFLELLDYNDFISICDCNIVRWENSLCTSLSSWKPTLWDIYKENNEAHNEKIDDFLEFLNEKWQYNNILKEFNSNNKKEAFTDFLDNYQNYNNLFQNLWNYINNNCDLYKNLKKIF